MRSALLSLSRESDALENEFLKTSGFTAPIEVP